MTEYNTNEVLTPAGITTGSDGNLWFTEFAQYRIGRITAAGVITEFSVANVPGEPYNITSGPEGDLWFTDLPEE